MEKWQDAHRELAKHLLLFYQNHEAQSGHELYKRLVSDKSFIKNNKWLSGMKKSSTKPAVDPVMIFSAFNQLRQESSTRELTLNRILKALKSKKQFHNLDFKGSPVPLSQKIKTVRDSESNIEIWDLFGRVMKDNPKGLTEKDYMNVSKWPGVDETILTIFLFWIQPKYFLPVDKFILDVLFSSRVIVNTPKTYLDYLKLIPQKNSEFYQEIVLYAYAMPTLRPEAREAFFARLQRFYRLHRTGFEENRFRLIAIRPLPGLKTKYCKVLKKGTLYQLNKQYEFLSDGKIAYNPGNEIEIYNQEGLRVQITAIVGKNGSGKSAITELLLMAINNLAHRKAGREQTDLIKVSGLCMELYFHTTTFQKILFTTDKITVTRYNFDGKQYTPGNTNDISHFHLEEFFYSISINYSNHGLNSTELGNWLNPLFEKNDAYQAPVALNPFRRKGNIDINREKNLITSRLIALLLDTVEEGSTEHRVLTDDGKTATHLTPRINKEKLKQRLIKSKDVEEDMWKRVQNFYKFSLAGFPASVQKAGKLYIVNKLCKMCNYKSFTNYFDWERGHPDPARMEQYFRHIDSYPSHITTKFKQAIHYFKYKTFKHLKFNIKNRIEKFSSAIIKIRNKYRGEQPLLENELLPPAFFKYNIHLDSTIDFHTLSSGERQKIYALSTIIYHLKNLESVSDEEMYVSYRNVNIIFDEIELYFHPDMQRSFIASLLVYMERARLEKISDINICFVTHSPFILSDILDTNTLFIEAGKPDGNLGTGRGTFGGNIHDMLAHNFFLKDGFMGKYAKQAINAAIVYLEKAGEAKDYADESKYSWNQNKVANFIDRIGEPLIQRSMRQLYSSTFLEEPSEIDVEIQRLIALKQKINDSHPK